MDCKFGNPETPVVLGLLGTNLIFQGGWGGVRKYL
jgi:hypothetical protein